MKVLSLTEDEINKLPYPENARKLGGVIVTLSEPSEEAEKIRRLFRIATGKLKLLK